MTEIKILLNSKRIAIPSGQPPAVGNKAVTQALEDRFAAFEIEVEYTSEAVIVGTEMAYNRLRATETHIPKDGGGPTDRSADSLWEYRRSPEGEWKQILAIWNYRE